jgi:hypothetical protein
MLGIYSYHGGSMPTDYLLYNLHTGDVLGTACLPDNVQPEALGTTYVRMKDIKNYDKDMDIFSLKFYPDTNTLEPEKRLKPGIIERFISWFRGKNEFQIRA